ncbi:MAG: CSLREA domain-containing protein, partial [Thermodesulfobacteriota bacterium]
MTKKTDEVADDGRCSLREAVTAANTNAPSGHTPGECIAGDPQPVIDVIRLRRGTYVLTLGGADDDLNQGGDLDVTGSVRIEGKGRGTKIKSR